MHTLGLDLSDPACARAVVVDDAGRIVARAVGGDARDAVHEATSLQPADFGGVASPVEDADVPLSEPRILARCTPGAAAVAAEHWVGAAVGARHAICLHIGDDVFAGLLLDGRPWTGAHNRAGAAAWLAINPVERQDYRRRGSLAAEISSKGIAHRLSWRIQAGDRSRVLELAGGSVDAITGAMVFDGARLGDGVAISVVRDTAKYIGMAVATLAAAIDPEVVVVSGSIAVADLMLDAARQECTRRLPPEAMTDLRVEFSTLGADAIALGAARLAQLARA
ncbi:MAG TPA: ROK family protein [Vicinamibacterales bacterium]|jgi:glucokinase